MTEVGIRALFFPHSRGRVAIGPPALAGTGGNRQDSGIEKVVIGIDGKRASQVAVDWVIERAQRSPLQVTLLTAVDPLVSDSTDCLAMKAAYQRIRGASPGTVVDSVPGGQPMLEGLAERSKNADLLVVGSHPHRSVRAVLSGSLSAELVSRAGCALVVVPDDWTPGGTAILVGVDDDDSSDEAVAFAAAQAKSDDKELVLVHSWRPPSVGLEGMAGFVVDPEYLEQDHRARLAQVIVGLERQELKVRGVTELGPIGVVLESQLSDAALLVLGSHGHESILGGLLGSTIQHLLHYGSVPIAIVRNGSRWASSGQ
ncbi:universal stress protein [Glaciihabitans sp. UYNi722]|uniref:universal stress protein n=1 Tax=Glaciihabitans sp. UYNi722 TaxID=3156344 RepID=UPI0033973F49